MEWTTTWRASETTTHTLTVFSDRLVWQRSGRPAAETVTRERAFERGAFMPVDVRARVYADWTRRGHPHRRCRPSGASAGPSSQL